MVLPATWWGVCAFSSVAEAPVEQCGDVRSACVCEAAWAALSAAAGGAARRRVCSAACDGEWPGAMARCEARAVVAWCRAHGAWLRSWGDGHGRGRIARIGDGACDAAWPMRARGAITTAGRRL